MLTAKGVRGGETTHSISTARRPLTVRITAAVPFQCVQCLLHKVSQVLALPLAVLNLVPQVAVLAVEQIQHWQQLPVVRHKRLSDQRAALDVHVARGELLQHAAREGHHLSVACVEGVLQGNDKLRYHWQNLVPAELKQVADALPSQKLVRVFRFAQAVREQRQEVVEIQGLDLGLPRQLVVHVALINDARQVATLIEAAQLGVRGVLTLLEGACLGRLGFCLGLAGVHHRRRNS